MERSHADTLSRVLGTLSHLERILFSYLRILRHGPKQLAKEQREEVL